MTQEKKSHVGQDVAIDNNGGEAVGISNHTITNWTPEDARRLNADISDMLSSRLARYIEPEDRSILTLAVAVVKNANWHEAHAEVQHG